MKISEDIYNHLSLNAKRNGYSSLADLESFFENFSQSSLKYWPLKSSNKFQNTFKIARINPDPFGFLQTLTIAADINIGENKFQILENFSLGENLKIEILSIYQTAGPKGNNFAFNFIERHRKFLKAFDELRQNDPHHEKSEIVLYAHSGKIDSYKTSGGYIWAIQGFDFANINELKQARQAFKKFAMQQGVSIAQRDLTLFCKPCHFAAFQCGVKVNGKPLGKAFLLQYSWYGKMSIPENNSDNEEYRYAMAYNHPYINENHTQKAAEELNRPYLKMMHRYYKKYAQPPKKKISFFNRLQKAVKIFG